VIALLLRDLRLAVRAGGGFGLGLVFFLIVVVLVPFGGFGLFVEHGAASLWLFVGVVTAGHTCLVNDWQFWCGVDRGA